MPTIYQIVVVALIAAFIILFLNKTGLRLKIRDYFDAKNIKILADLVDCDFCLSFWICVCISLAFMLSCYELYYMIIPICATPITRHLL